VERRKFPRQNVRGTSLKATLVLTGGSLLKTESYSAVEIDAHPIDLSEGGIRLFLDAHWATFSPQKEVDLFLVNSDERKPVKATVVRYLEDVRELSLEFQDPLDVSRYLLRPSLH
jgi:hypothetical protein